MALLTVQDIARRAATMLDDPGQRRFTTAYLMPHIDQANEELMVLLEKLGAKETEQFAVFNVAGQPNGGWMDLTPYFAAGQPLQYCMRPKKLWWKLQGQPDTSYVLSDLVDTLDDVLAGNQGCQQWDWTGGTILTLASSSGVTLRIQYDALSTAIYDPVQNVTRGIGHLIAVQVADFVAALNNGMGQLGAKLTLKLTRVKNNFANLLTMQNQRENRIPRGTKRGAAVQISAGGTPFV